MAGLVVRQDLSLHQAQPSESGGPAWVLHDPTANRYFRLPPEELELLACIGAGGAERIADAASKRLGWPVPASRAEQFMTFLVQNNLAVLAGDAGRQLLLTHRQMLRRPTVGRIASNMLFLRIPLLRPDRFLEATLPWVEWWFHPWTTRLIALAALLGLMLVLRQWDAFASGFPEALDAAGVLTFAVVLSLVKALHELGHAYTAKRAGCRVGTMGVALLVFWPVLYTDCSDAWTLRSRRQRLAIDAAGIKVEIGAAALCLLLWSMLPDGPARAFLQVLATSNLLLTLSINLNPLMRFDGYFILSDWLSMPNLQPRSMALAKWWFDDLVLRQNLPPPEPPRGWMIAYGLAVQAYRLALALIIALMIYHFAFKVLGLALITLQLGSFVVRPAALALLRVRQVWPELPSSRRWRLAELAFGLLIVLLLPWRATLEAPAHLQAQRVLHIYAPANGRVARLADAAGKDIEAGQELVGLEAPDLGHERAKLVIHVEGLRRQLAVSGFSDTLLERQAVLLADLESSLRRIATLEERLASLRVAAPFDGVVVDRQPDLAIGAWVAEGETLLSLVDPREWEVAAYVREAELGRLAVGTKGVFVPAGGGREAFAVVVRRIDVAALRELDSPYPASVFGGPLPTRRDEAGRLLPQEAVYRIWLSRADQDRSRQGSLYGGMMSGTVSLAAQRESLGGAILRTTLGVLRREAGF